VVHGPASPLPDQGSWPRVGCAGEVEHEARECGALVQASRNAGSDLEE
jgi:hypothetical protein